MSSVFSKAGFAVAVVLAAHVFTAPSAEAVVYCKYVGVPQGCVVQPGVVYAPAPVVRAATPGVGAPGVGVAPGVGAPGVNTPWNRGGPVNRVGRR